MVDLNTTLNATVGALDTTLSTSITLLQPIVHELNQLLTWFQYAVGGALMLYVILIYLRWREQKRLVSTLTRIDRNIQALCQKLRVVPERRKRSAIKHAVNTFTTRLSKLRRR